MKRKLLFLHTEHAKHQDTGRLSFQALVSSISKHAYSAGVTQLCGSYHIARIFRFRSYLQRFGACLVGNIQPAQQLTSHC